MIKSLHKRIKRNLINLPGWRSKRRIVVIESDDWGSIRMSSKEAYNHFLEKGYPVDKDPYNRFDSLESNDDLEKLFGVLSSVKDKNGNPALMTANSLVANPDFDKIKESGFTSYFYEPLPKTLEKYPNHDRVLNLFKEGILNRVIKPQFHGREHLNVNVWMNALRSGEVAVREAFAYRMQSFHSQNDPVYFNEYMDALAFQSDEDIPGLSMLLEDGTKLFRELWGFDSRSFIAPCYIWSSSLEQTLRNCGVKYIQGMINQFEPISGTPFKYDLKYHYMGQKNKLGQRYLIRNAFFEPSHTPETDSVGDCLKRISTSFIWNKPAIISTHRLNFMGSLIPENRDNGLRLLAELLKQIVGNWPDVEFMSSDELGDLMNVNEN
jgi:hypothetical protein